ncbi:ComEA family DNA-binding protein [Vibrio sinaloensis]|uniref:ComEA family DNA-binding protein n=1 Tax=Photobacterium sp. (strain ATCC 43367) TaxID=379097 RepID=UPI00204C780F|nr:ComEA family DNA-binding protein [Vibrio sinaloensis]UPQ88777.1 ComEA family DNA-binding protein [Vibrio sinaloensis]
MIKQLVFILVLLCSVPMTFAQQETENVKYEGIEITVNINQASAEELADLLQGIGLKKAQAIVSYREQNGNFSSADGLTAVKGIGLATVEKNRHRIQL